MHGPLRVLVVLAFACSPRVVVLTGADDDDDDGAPPTPGLAACLDDLGIELYAAEADRTLALSWNTTVAVADAGGHYRIRWGAGAGEYSDELAIECPLRSCEATLRGLPNDALTFVVVDTVDDGGAVLRTSCEVAATPHVVVFTADAPIDAAASSTEDQDSPEIVAAAGGHPLFVAWEGAGGSSLARSDDRGDTWDAPVPLGVGASAGPALAFRDPLIVGEVVEVPAALFIAIAEGGNVYMIEGAFPDGVNAPMILGAPILVGTGSDPDVTATADAVHVAWVQDGTIVAAARPAGSASLGPAIRVDTGEGAAAAPSIAANPLTGAVYVAFQATRAKKDTDIYLGVSTDHGASFGAAEIRIDDDPGAALQQGVSLELDARSQVLYAIWEDDRDGADVTFSRSFDDGATWEPSRKAGASVDGDQLTPKAALDRGHNGYAIVLDTADGRRPIFSRFNTLGAFDPPLRPSDGSGKNGDKADHPAVAVDRRGTIYAAWSEKQGEPHPKIYFARAE